MFKYTDAQGEIRPWKVGIHAVLGLVILIILLGNMPFTTVGAGERGVVLHFSAVNNEVLDPGLHAINPVATSVIKMNVQVQKEQVTAEAASHDLQTVKAEVALNYHLDSARVADIYRKVGEDYKVKLIDPAIQESVKAVTANYTAEELITKREQVRADIKDSLAQKLNNQGLLVDEFNVINFDFSPQFNAAIESKVTAEQNALAAKNKLDQVQYEAQQRIAQANGEAKAIQIQSQAVNAQGGADYVKLQAIKQWDGHLPNTMLGSATPFIDIGK